jgi:hypothetical protein
MNGTELCERCVENMQEQREGDKKMEWQGSKMR